MRRKILMLIPILLAYGASVQAMDKETAEQYKREIAECDNVPKERLIAQGMAENDRPWDVTNGHRKGLALAMQYPAKCKQEVHQRYFGSR